MTTTYKLAIGPDDLTKCHDALHMWGMPHAERHMDHPCLMAFRDNRLVGFISTAPLDEAKAVVCNRIAVDPELTKMSKAFLVIRMVEGYERVLKGAGMKWYHVSLDSTNQHFIKLIERAFDSKPYAEVEREGSAFKTVWFKREIA